jgi:sugar transferase (PEP-CTERM system associated)
VHYLLDRYVTVKSLVLVALDVAVIAGSTTFAVWLRLGRTVGEVWAPDGFRYPIALIIFVHMVTLYYHEMYALRPPIRLARLFVLVAQAVAVASLLLFILYYLVPELSVGRGIFLINMLLLPPLLTGSRVVYVWLGRQEVLQQRLLVMGEVAQAREVVERLKATDNYRLVGAVYTDEAPVDEGVPRPLGTVAQLKEIVLEHRIDGVIVAMRERRGRLPLQDLLYLKLYGVRVDNESGFLERVTGRVPVTGLPPSTLIFSDGFRRISVYQQVKFFGDVALAACLLVLLLPVLLAVAVAVRLDSPGPAFFRQTRVGRAGQPFPIIKFRTMRTDAEAEGARFAEAEDPRVTRLGRWLRKTRVDELPQLLNVLRGEMAFVGPRPERPEFVADLQEKIPYYYLRTVIRPGITGWAQIRYPYGATIKEHREKLEHDLYYIKNISLGLDALIAIETLRVILFAQGAR